MHRAAGRLVTKTQTGTGTISSSDVLWDTVKTSIQNHSIYTYQVLYHEYLKCMEIRNCPICEEKLNNLIEIEYMCSYCNKFSCNTSELKIHWFILLHSFFGYFFSEGA